MKDALVDIQNLSLSLDEKPILSGVDLSIEEGAYISIVGPNGAGKTSLIKCLARIYLKWTGTVTLAGESLRSYQPKALARQLSYVPQGQYHLFPFTVIDFVTLGRYPHLSPFTSIRKEDHDAVQEALELAGVESFKHRVFNTLSGGERQMVLIAAALAQGARILLLDEPATSLDYRHQADVMRLLKRINRDSGITMISVNHDINSAALWSDRMVAIKNGSVFCEGTPEEIMQRDRLEQIYDTPFRLIERSPAVPLAFAEGVV